MNRTKIASVPIAVLLLGATAIAAQAGVDTIIDKPITAPEPFAADIGQRGLDDVRAITAEYHWLPNALEAGFVPFSLEGTDEPTCFESQAGGMGVHYVRNVDDTADATDPEAMVYEVGDDGGVRLVGVEYVVPEEFVEDADGNVVALPSLHGQEFHKHSSLPLYILHAWIWEENSEGVFADFNPAVNGCPTA